MSYKFNPFTNELDYYSGVTTGAEIVTLLEALASGSRLSHDDGLSDVSVDDHHNQAHVLNAGDHTVSGLTIGHFLKATGATTFGFAAHGLTYSDVGADVSGAAAAVQSNLDTLTSAVATALDLRCLESVFGTTLGTGIILDSAALKVSIVLQIYHGINPSADVQSVLGCANEAAIRTFLDLEVGTDFYSISTLDTALALKAALAGPTFTGTVTVPSTNFTIGSTTFSEAQLQANTAKLDGLVAGLLLGGM